MESQDVIGKSGPGISDGEAGSQEQVRLSAGNTARGGKARGGKGREGAPTVGGEKPEGDEAQEGSGLDAV
jgi:hypothetical protein